MATTTITKQNVAANGFNLTGATFTTMSTGSGNGVEFDYHPHNIVVLFNDATGGDAVYTVKVKQEAKYSGSSITVPDEAITVANNATWLYPSLPIHKDANAKMIIECDVAAKVIVVRHKID